jgi:hypothetical protein
MTESRERSEWGRLSSLMALIANVNRDPKRRGSYKPAEFNPYFQGDRYSELTRRKRAKAPLTVLRDLWCRGQKKEGGR